MTRFLLKLALLMILLLTITSLAARALGGTQPPNPVLGGFTEGCEGKPQPHCTGADKIAGWSELASHFRLFTFLFTSVYTGRWYRL